MTPAVDQDRERQQQRRFRQLAEQHGLNPEVVQRVFRAVIDEVVRNHSHLAGKVPRVDPVDQSGAQDTQPVTSVRPRTALVVIDAQVGVLGSVWESKRVVGNIVALVNQARVTGTPVVWVQHSDQELKSGSDAWQLIPDLKPEPSDPVIHKTFNSSFAATDLDVTLKRLGVRRLVLAGALTNWCIRATAFAAMERGYDLLIVSDAHSTDSLQASENKMIAASDIIDEFNSVMRWISAPDVRVEVMRTGDVR